MMELPSIEDEYVEEQHSIAPASNEHTQITAAATAAAAATTTTITIRNDDNSDLYDSGDEKEMPTAMMANGDDDDDVLPSNARGFHSFLSEDDTKKRGEE